MMSDDIARIRLKIGQFEIEYEGKDSFLKDDLCNLMEKFIAFHAEHKDAIPVEIPINNTNTGGTGSTLDQLEHSTNTIAAHLNATTGTELAVAAAAHLAFVKNQEKFGRQDINGQMKSATTYYKTSMTSNLSKSLNTLVKARRLNQVAKDLYALSATERNTLEGKLAQSF